MSDAEDADLALQLAKTGWTCKAHPGHFQCSDPSSSFAFCPVCGSPLIRYDGATYGIIPKEPSHE